MGRHRSGYILPTTKSMSFQTWCHRCNNLSTIGHRIGCKNLITDLKGKQIEPIGITTRDGYIIGRHRGGKIVPTTEFKSFLDGRIGCYNRCSIKHRVGTNDFIADFKGQQVFIHEIIASDNHILGWHRFWYIMPTRESVTFLHRCIGCRNRCSIKHRVSTENFITNLKGEQVLIGDVTACNDHVLGWHGFWHVLPTTEDVSLLHRSIGHRNRRAILNGIRNDCFIINQEREQVLINLVAGFRHYILFGHRCWEIIPLHKGMPLFLRCSNWHYGLAGIPRLRIVNFVIHHISEGVGRNIRVVPFT